MNQYCYDDIYIGMADHFSVKVTENMHRGFEHISGDNNPMHIDNTYAQEMGYKQCLVYGMLTASFYSTLVGVYLPGKYVILQEVATAFNTPVYVGDTLTITGVVDERRDKYKRIGIKAKITNQDGILVSKATIKVGVLR